MNYYRCLKNYTIDSPIAVLVNWWRTSRISRKALSTTSKTNSFWLVESYFWKRVQHNPTRWITAGSLLRLECRRMAKANPLMAGGAVAGASESDLQAIARLVEARNASSPKSARSSSVKNISLTTCSPPSSPRPLFDDRRARFGQDLDGSHHWLQGHYSSKNQLATWFCCLILCPHV